MWKNLNALLEHSGLDYHWVVLISSGAALPTIWILRLSEMSGLQFLGFFSSSLIVIAMIVVYAIHGELGDVDTKMWVGPDIPLSIGIFVLSLAGHASLPQIYDEMKHPKNFNRMVDTTFLLMFIVYAGCGVIGFLIYGSDTNILVSVNMVDNPGGILPKIMTGVIVAKNYFTIAPLTSVLCSSTEIIMGIGEKPMLQRLFRTFMFLLAMCIGYLAWDELPFLESITGAVCTMMTSFICPTAFSMVLFRGELGIISRCIHIVLFTFGCVMMVFLSYGAISSLFSEHTT